MKYFSSAFLLFFVLSGLSCSHFLNTKNKKPDLISLKLEQEVLKLGAKNWILVTDSAYGIPENANTSLILSGKTLDQTLSQVLQQIDSLGHVWPRIYTLREFEFLEPSHAPGINAIKAARKVAMGGRANQIIPNSTAFILLKNIIKEHKILIVKSSSAFPYSSVYLELDSGYWNSRSEAELRAKMAN